MFRQLYKPCLRILPVNSSNLIITYLLTSGLYSQVESFDNHMFIKQGINNELRWVYFDFLTLVPVWEIWYSKTFQ